MSVDSRTPWVVTNTKPKTYTFTSRDRQDLALAQGHQCAVCRKPEGSQPLVEDTDHASGVVHGLVCRSCHAGLQAFKRDQAELMRAAAYLRKKSPWADAPRTGPHVGR